jgi:crossover junction endodeoxyribonuclease RuvC
MEKCNIALKKDEKVFVGIDPSIRGTGIVVLDQDGCIMEQILVGTSDTNMPIEQRLLKILEAVRFIPNIIRLKTVYIEGPSYGSKGNRALQLGALHFLIRIFLYEKNVNFSIIAPKTLKLFHAHDANANKSKVIEMVEELFGEKFKDHNLADAYGLARMALENENTKG